MIYLAVAHGVCHFLLSKGIGHIQRSAHRLPGILRAQGIEGEFADPDYVVFMITPEIGKAGLDRLEKALMELPAKTAILEAPPKFHLPQRALSIRVAAFSESEVIPVAEGLGRILASPTVGCPPAVPVVACGERIDEAALNCFRYYGINTCTVVR